MPFDICRIRIPGPRARSLAYAITPWHNFTMRMRDHFPEIASLPEERGEWIGQCQEPFIPRARRRSGWERSGLFRISLETSALLLSFPSASCESLHGAFTRVHAPTRTAFQSFLSSANLHLGARSYGRAVTKVDVADATMRALSRRWHLRRSRPFQIIILVGGYHFTFHRVSSPG